MNERYRKPILEANILYLVLGIGLLYVGGMVQSREIYSGLLITEYILILLPNLLYVKMQGYSLRKVLKLNRITFKQALMVIGITIFTYPIAIFCQAIFLGILTRFIEVRPHIIPMPESGIQYIVGFLIMALSPGICEEIMFRGVMLHAYEELGYRKGIIITGILFGMFHFTLLNLVGPIVLGIVFGIMVYKTKSIYSSILGHTFNNGIALTLGYILNRYGYMIDEYMNEASNATDMTLSIGGIITVMVFLLICLIVVNTLLKKLSPSDERSCVQREFNMILSNPSIGYGLEYIPIIIAIGIFIYINWKYIIL